MKAVTFSGIAARLPGDLAPQVESRWQAFAERCRAADVPLPRHPEFLWSLARVWAASDFVASSCVQNPELLHDLLQSGDLLAEYPPGAMARRVAGALEGVRDEADLGRRLRRLRRRETVRIAWRDLAGWAGVEEVLEDLSALADACIEGALDRLYAWQCKEAATPRDGRRRPQRLSVLAMGKLGARELNFSSDIDLIFVYPEAGEIRRPRLLSHEEFFTRLGRRLISVLNDNTPEGFVYRVDMRLRPYGDSGPLVMDFAQFEDYYQSQGREWERYAMIKARPLGGDPEANAALMELLRPFVYRRYLDFGAFEQLRDMKAMIEREVARRGMGDNVKLGPGGIREVEFIVQAFQLVRGGREPRLQRRGLLETLAVLGELELLPAWACERLAGAYRFLRRLENRLQAWQDAQTHELPRDEEGKARVAFAMGFGGWAAFEEALEAHRQFVAGQFAQVFAAPQSAAGGLESPFAALWEGLLEPEQARRRLEEAGYEAPGESLRLLEQMRSGVAERLGAQGRERLRRLMPLLLGAVTESERPSRTLARVLRVIEAIAGRSAYLALLVEYPVALSQLVRLCGASPWIATELARHPLLLDELLDPRTLYRPPSREELGAQLEQRFQAIDPEDLEEQMEALRQFRQAAVLRVAAADVAGAAPLMEVSDHLTAIAEVVLERVLAVAWEHLTARHGRPRRGGRRGPPAGFAIIGYGKLGGMELGYGSDLDLVFLHDAMDGGRTDGRRPLDNAVFFARLGQRIIHILNTRTPSGILYEIDMRLRPSGASGLLVTDIGAFAHYQREEAWTWEHQALVRARPVAGSEGVAQAFAEVRREVLCLPRDPERLRGEVRDMRERMRAELGSRTPGRFDLKQDRGGIADIEFMVQYQVLRWAHEHPELVRYSDNIRLLGTLAEAGLLTPERAALLADAYRSYRERGHRLALQEEKAVVDASEFAELRRQVAEIWDEMMGE